MRLFAIGLEHCSNCNGELKIIAAILDIKDPAQRLLGIRDVSATARVQAKRAKRLMLMGFFSFGMPLLMQTMASLYGRKGVADAMGFGFAAAR